MADEAPRRAGALIALDWGTTSFRAWLLDGAGTVVDEVRTDDGTLNVSAGCATAESRAGAFARTFARLCRPWLDAHPAVPVLGAGMVGSNHGWAEARYLEVPTGLDDLATGLVRVSAGDVLVHIVPGLRVTGPEPDVMRGEEVQLVGVLATAETERPVTVVLPGTHTKWVRLDGDRVTGFATAMTGELYGLLMRDSILSRLAIGTPAPVPTPAFLLGLETEADRGDERGLPALLFTARTLVMAGRLAADEVADYLSGMLVGADVRHAVRAGLVADGSGVVAVCGARPTMQRYRLALERAGATVRVVEDDATAHGLWAIACSAGLVPTTEEIHA